MLAMPKILVIDTAYAACSVALQADSQVLAAHTDTERCHNELILPMVQQVLSEAGLTLTDLDAVAFGCGPGSFTGVRIAASVVQGLAYAMSCPVIRISSLQAIAEAQFQKTGNANILVAIDAHMQAIYSARFTWHNGFMNSTGPEQQIAIADFQVPAGKWLVVGDAYRAYPDLPRPDTCTWQEQGWQTEAKDLLPLALAKYAQQDTVGAALALPTYLSETHWRKLPGRT